MGMLERLLNCRCPWHVGSAALSVDAFKLLVGAAAFSVDAFQSGGTISQETMIFAGGSLCCAPLSREL